MQESAHAQVVTPSPSHLCGAARVCQYHKEIGTVGMDLWRTVEPSLTVGLLPRDSRRAIARPCGRLADT